MRNTPEPEDKPEIQKVYEEATNKKIFGLRDVIFLTVAVVSSFGFIYAVWIDKSVGIEKDIEVTKTELQGITKTLETSVTNLQRQIDGISNDCDRLRDEVNDLQKIMYKK